MLELTCFTFPASEEKNNRKDFYWSEEAAAVITCHIITVHSPPDRQLSLPFPLLHIRRSNALLYSMCFDGVMLRFFQRRRKQSARCVTVLRLCFHQSNVHEESS